MSIRGIDSQIMITRTADASRDASALQKRPEVAQDYQAQQSKVQEARDQTRVAKTLESEMENIRADEDGGGNGGYESGSGMGSGGDEPEDDFSTLVPPSNNMIDIKI